MNYNKLVHSRYQMYVSVEVEARSRGPCEAALTRLTHSVDASFRAHVDQNATDNRLIDHLQGAIVPPGCRVHVFVLMLPSCRVGHWPE
jgi:hypothetical protein